MMSLCRSGDVARLTATQPALAQTTMTTTLQPRPEDNNNDSGAGPFTFFPGKPRWTRPDRVLTYAVSPTATADHLSPSAVRAALRSAFARWADVIPMRFQEAERYDAADIKVGFYLYTDGRCDGCACIDSDDDDDDGDDCEGVLAHSSMPEKSGQIHLHAAHRWTVNLAADTAPLAVDLESVAAHEIGHVLGLDHSSSRSSMMYPFISCRERKVRLTTDDVHGIQELYGANPHFSFGAYFKQDILSRIQQMKKEKKKKARGSSFWQRGLALTCAVIVTMIPLPLSLNKLL
ncbi:metalloendoproteinase 4-MMP-like [Oryza glaberrima]|uniref:metalloendoproteinase 4-MMP-like n=1 Tax=Oryza glaberrima TaxID=4538 RepID=UPI00023DF650|nr:metalloendoproteinase 4-MMP-like [Oryza glaberrima]